MAHIILNDVTLPQTNERSKFETHIPHNVKTGTPSRGTFTHTALKDSTPISGRLVFRPNPGEFNQEKSFTERVLFMC